MLKTTMAGLRAHLLRLMLTGLAITLGVGFVAGTFVLTDTMQAGFDQQFTASADRVSAAVLPKGDRTDIAAALLGRIRTVPGVREAQGRVRGTAALIGKDGRAYGDDPTVGLSVVTGELQRYPVAKDRAPGGPGEVVLGTQVARRSGYGVGDTVRVLDAKGTAHAFTVSGVVDFGVDQEIAIRGAVGFTPAVAARMTGERGFTEIDVKAAPGVGNARVRDAVAAVTGPSYRVVTSAQLAKRMAQDSGVDASQITVFFLAFALVALFVAMLVIYNTFNILIAQRVREMALLRCVGATRGQVFRGVLAESAVVGLAASVLGVLAGVGLGYGAALIFDAGTGMPGGGGLALSATPFLVGIPVGLAVTVLSALLPARSATRVPPVAALRVQPDEPEKGRAGVLRIVGGVLLSLAGAAVTALAVARTPGMTAFGIAMAGGAVLFLGIVTLSPLVVRTLSGVVGAVPARLFRVPGRLAVANSRRNPRRAAITTIALTVGVALMTMFSVTLASAQATTEAKLSRQFPIDYQLGTQAGGARKVPAAVAARLRATPQFAKVIEVRETSVVVGGRSTDVGAVTERYLGGTIKPKVTSGSLDELRPGAVVLAGDVAHRLGTRVGGDVPLRTGQGTVSLRVAAILGGGSALPDVLLDESDFARHFDVRNDTWVFVIVKKGVSADASRAAIDEILKPYPLVKVRSAADIKAQFTKGIDQAFYLVAGLLALAILISLIGIANTLTLSVVERTRESALLRALGLTRRGLRRMLSLEALILSLVGAVIGVAFGVALGWIAISTALSGAVLGLPVGRIVIFVVVAGVAGVIAAVLPARRAARASIAGSLVAD